jgi:hypothetical protein
MKDNLNELQESEWFTLPKYLMTAYGRILGTHGLCVYAYLAAIADEAYQCKYDSYYLGEALKLRERKVEKILRKLEQLNLIKVHSIGRCQLLWKPCA